MVRPKKPYKPAVGSLGLWRSNRSSFSIWWALNVQRRWAHQLSARLLFFHTEVLFFQNFWSFLWTIRRSFLCSLITMSITSYFFPISKDKNKQPNSSGSVIRTTPEGKAKPRPTPYPDKTERKSTVESSFHREHRPLIFWNRMPIPTRPASQRVTILDTTSSNK